MLNSQPKHIMGKAWLCRIAIMLSPVYLFLCYRSQIFNMVFPRPAIQIQHRSSAVPEHIVGYRTYAKFISFFRMFSCVQWSLQSERYIFLEVQATCSTKGELKEGIFKLIETMNESFYLGVLEAQPSGRETHSGSLFHEDVIGADGIISLCGVVVYFGNWNTLHPKKAQCGSIARSSKEFWSRYFVWILAISSKPFCNARIKTRLKPHSANFLVLTTLP